jgi:hypothetical protein
VKEETVGNQLKKANLKSFIWETSETTNQRDTKSPDCTEKESKSIKLHSISIHSPVA